MILQILITLSKKYSNITNFYVISKINNTDSTLTTFISGILCLWGLGTAAIFMHNFININIHNYIILILKLMVSCTLVSLIMSLYSLQLSMLFIFFIYLFDTVIYFDCLSLGDQQMYNLNLSKYTIIPDWRPPVWETQMSDPSDNRVRIFTWYPAYRSWSQTRDDWVVRYLA